VAACFLIFFKPAYIFFYLGSQKASSSTKDSHQPKEAKKRPTGSAQGLSATYPDQLHIHRM
jgi:hypothetical protein